MRIVEINTVRNGSTGNIMLQIAHRARKHGETVYTFSKSWNRNVEQDGHKYFGSYWGNWMHCVLGRLTGMNGLFSFLGTPWLLHKITQLNPDIIHLHNIHDFCLNFPMLFRYLKRKKIQVVWTLHDCWAFTGHCAHYEMAKCEKWKNGCYKCPLYRFYPKSFVDNSKWMYAAKKKWITRIGKLTFVVPSRWLADQLKQSYLQHYPVEVINNGIDLSIFKPEVSEFREKYQCTGKFLILGVALEWCYIKGIDVFIRLSQQLDERYQIILVGTDERIDRLLDRRIISIHRTESKQELARIYSAVDVFLNPTRGDTFPTVNIEALACGTPVITSSTGGSPEIIDPTCGIVVNCDDIEEIIHAIYDIKNKTMHQSCCNRAKQFKQEDKYDEYVELYRSITRNFVSSQSATFRESI